MNLRKLLLIGFTSLLAQASIAQSKVFVNATATGTHTGASWATAFNDLSVAITAASPGDTIFIAAGTYKPSIHVGTGSDPRDNTFLLKDNVLLYGGFAGTETQLSDRDESKILSTNATVLSGNTGAPDSADNCYHVVTAINLTSKTYLNGLIITNGNANGIGSNTISGKVVPRYFGGGIYCDNASPNMKYLNIDLNYASGGGAGMNNENGSALSLSNSSFYGNIINGTDPGNGGGGAMRNNGSNVNLSKVDFSYNKAYHTQGGGAVRNEASAAIFTDVAFEQNYSEDGDGGGAVYNANGSNSFFTNTQFTLNSTDNQGGAMYNDASSPTLTKVDFYRNSANGATGAMENDGGSNAILNKVTFTENTTMGDGGAMQNWKSSPLLTDVTFDNNSAGGDGGAIYNYNTCSPILNRCKIINNAAAGNGGGFFNKRGSNPIITNTLISFNNAGNDGGGIYNIANNSTTGSEPCSPIFTNISIANNIAGNTGGGGYDDGWGSSKLRNSIVAGNHSSNVDDIDAPLSMVSTALFRAIVGDEYYVTGVSAPIVISGDIFLDTMAADFRLAEFSPALNVGDSSFYTVGASPDISSAGILDIRAADRIMGLNIDLGAFEVCTDTLKPTVSISPSTTTTVASGASVVFMATITGGGTTPYYSWKKNGIAVGAFTASYAAIAGTDFVSGDKISVDIIGSSDIACMSADTIKSSETEMLITTSIGAVANNDVNIKIYPNPNKGTFILETDLNNGMDFLINILDFTGRIIYSDSFNGGTKSLNLSGKVAAGSYLLIVENAELPKQVIRFVIQ